MWGRGWQCEIRRVQCLNHSPQSTVCSPQSTVGSPQSAVEIGARREAWLKQQRAECIDEEQWLQEYCCVPADESAAFITYDMLNACQDQALRHAHVFLVEPGEMPPIEVLLQKIAGHLGAIRDRHQQAEEDRPFIRTPRLPRPRRSQVPSCSACIKTCMRADRPSKALPSR